MKARTDFAYMLMGECYNPQIHNAVFEINGGKNYIVTVKNMDEAIKKAKELMENGVGCIEVCGAFGEENAKRLISELNNEIAIGYSTHFESENEKFDKFFS